MTDDAKQTIYLKDYKPFAYVVEDVHLTFTLAPQSTRVLSRIRFAPTEEATGVMFLHGEELSLLNASIDGEPASYRAVTGGIEIDVPDGDFLWQCEVEISPETNTALEGLYMSNGMYCTQCEAEGFRKITYYPDRPDVMAVFTVRIESDLPVLLSNGNPTGSGEGWAEWHDPWPKPAYLFALVAGELVNHPDRFTTRSGNDVELNIWVRPADIEKCAFGMDALKRSMKWDEDVYGREYDLDVFNIVAVDDFNMGAMENKGLNIFNSSCVLASPDTSTDQNYERIEAIVAHEYFHNWTGNRITCRDWFQLCLKEGLTVFRDQQFTGDMRSHAVKRIDDVVVLRARQFREDQGPLAHPVRPESFVEINNFYTVTVYEKGAEVIGMLKRLVGDEAYDKALDLYFERHDGDAATIEDWIQVFEDATGRDLTQFKLWYQQAGTPHVHVIEDWNDGTFTLTLRQEHKPSPNQDVKEPMVIPVAVGLLDQSGKEVVATQMLELTEAEQSFTFDGLAERPIPSILRGFSAPVVLHQDRSKAELQTLLAHDTDSFNKWEAGRTLARDLLLDMILEGAAPDEAFLASLEVAISDDSADPAFRAQLLRLPTIDDLAQALSAKGHTPDPSLISARREALRLALAQHCETTLGRLYDSYQVEGSYSPDAISAGKRALTNAALSYLSLIDGGSRAAAQYKAADNMTQELSALDALTAIGKGGDELADFYERWQHDRLVIDKWFLLQTRNAEPEKTAEVARTLTEHAAFDWKNPNRFRSLFGGLTANTAGFHHESGDSYALLAEWLIKLDGKNPQTAARMSTAFDTWKLYGEARQTLMRDQLNRIAASEGLSRDMSEMVERMLNA